MINEIFVLDSSFQPHYILELFESLIWTIRYSNYGDFELYIPMNSEVKEHIKQDEYLYVEGSDRLMIVEEIQITNNIEEGPHAIIRGRSLESVLTRRIVWKQTMLDGYLEGQIEKLLNQNAISPDIASRKIPNLIFEKSGDSRITELKISAQFTGDNLYDVIKSICDANSLGFKIIFKNNKWVFKLYLGLDRSYEQDELPYVVFAPSFDNIINSNYIESKKTLRNVTLVAGEGEGSDRKTLVVGDAEISGLSRRELFTDARDISSITEDDKELPLTEYNKLLKQRGEEDLSGYKETKTFDGQAETSMLFRYNEHFTIGDIVQFENEHGYTGRVRVVEYIQSITSSGFSDYPTFENIE